MKMLIRALCLSSISSFAFAVDSVPPLVLDKILFQLSAKQWVSTHTALLNVTINVTLSTADLVKARADIMDRLKKVAPGDWHLTSFYRSQDSSGLEKLFVQAQNRVDQKELTNIYQNAKSVSMPGAKYEVNGIDFTPSLEEVQAVRTAVREQLYAQVNAEMTRINKAYPTQNYTVSLLSFTEGDTSPYQEPRAYRAKAAESMTMLAASPPALTVSNELVLTAVVEAASNRKQGN